MSDALNPVDYEINRLIDKLDQKAVEMEARWGVYFLESRCSEDMGTKWQRQVDKLNDAIDAHNLAAVSELVGGSIRGYDALEADVMARGFTPPEPDVWQVHDGSRICHIVRTVAEARRLAQEGKENVITVEDASRLLNGMHDRMMEEKVSHPVAKEMFDFDKGDEIPI